MGIPLIDQDKIPESLKPVLEISSLAGRVFIQAMSNAPQHAERLLPYYNGTRYGSKVGIKLSELIRLAIVNSNGCYT